MRKRFLTLAHAGLTLSCVACCVYLLWRDRHREQGHDRLSFGADVYLRHFHKVRWLGGDYELPAGENHCAIVVLKYQDGRYVGRHTSWHWSAESGESRVVPFMVMWSPTPTGPRSMTFSGGIWGFTSDSDVFAKLDGALGRSHGPTSLGEVRGYRVIGYAGSSEAWAAPENAAGELAAFGHSLRDRKHVVVLGIKTFPTKDEASHWALGERELPDAQPTLSKE